MERIFPVDTHTLTEGDHLKAPHPNNSIGEPGPIGVSAQNWTSDEQVPITAIKHCWDRAANDQPTPNHVVSWALISQALRPIHVQVGGDFGFIYFHGPTAR